MTGKPQYQVRVPAGEAYGRVEAPKGELGFYVISNGKPNPWRYHVRAPSFINLTALEQMCVGTQDRRLRRHPGRRSTSCWASSTGKARRSTTCME